MNQLFEQIQGVLPVEFTTKDLAAALKAPLRLGQQAAYCFREAGVTAICGKAGNALIYRRTARAGTAPEAQVLVDSMPD